MTSSVSRCFFSWRKPVTVKISSNKGCITFHWNAIGQGQRTLVFADVYVFVLSNFMFFISWKLSQKPLVISSYFIYCCKSIKYTLWGYNFGSHLLVRILSLKPEVGTACVQSLNSSQGRVSGPSIAWACSNFLPVQAGDFWWIIFRGLPKIEGR